MHYLKLRSFLSAVLLISFSIGTFAATKEKKSSVPKTNSTLEMAPQEKNEIEKENQKENENSTQTPKEKKADLSSSEDSSQESDSKVPVSVGRYVTGGVLASTVGFGIGHSIQGRYSDKGFIFTIVELGSLLLISSANNRCHSNSNDSYSCYSEDRQVSLGLAALIGFHVWEVVDAWAGATPVSDEKSVSAMVLPKDKDGFQFAFSYQF